MLSYNSQAFPTSIGFQSCGNEINSIATYKGMSDIH